MMGFLTENFGWKLLSIGAAFLVWMSVASEPELATIVSVPVEYRNYPSDLEISSDIVSDINVEARGPAGQLRSLHDSRVAAVVDFAGVNAPGERTFTLTASELDLPRGIDLIRTIPAQLRFRFERRINRMVPVEVPHSGTLPPGIVIASQDVEPQELRIGGPESRVLAVKKLISDPLDVSHLTGDTEEKLSVYAADAEVRFLNTPRVTVKVKVQRGD
jgi:YbbR domain-containing protein